ncbi:MAG: AEC family transporter [Corynebacterium sp.]|uniref:AEC family transporter n=1 Tax=Corynebacterium sp. TaxID=1720 RepID=UPI0026DED703|nr:AEC family transporter [Corynebacterium sp.]MDO5668728.1 AEC family transporter [Corynebacterium sp.]
MVDVLSGFGVVVLVIAVGYFYGRVQPTSGRALASLVYFVATPALIIDILLRTDPREIFSASFVVVAASALLTGALAFFLFRLRGRSAPDSIIGMLASSYANGGNLGIPLAVYLLDDAAIVIPVILFQVAFYAPVALTLLDMDVSRNLTVVLKNPLLIAAVVGLVIPVPPLMAEAVGILAGAAVPVALLVFGMSLVGTRVRIDADVLLAVTCKNFLHPVLAGLLAYALGAPLYALVVLGALPTAQNVLTYAVRFRTNEVLARDAGVVSTLVSFPVLVVVTLLLG